LVGGCFEQNPKSSKPVNLLRNASEADIITTGSRCRG
jgi:hypothetical protein